MTNAPTSLQLIQMKRISGYHYFLHLFTNSTLQYVQHVQLYKVHLFECKLVCWVFGRVDTGRTDSLITQNLNFDWSIQITWKHKAAGKSDLFE